MSDTESSEESIYEPTAIPDPDEDAFAMMIVAIRKKGKTTLLTNILYDQLADKFDKVYFFCPTFYKDPAYRVIKIPPEQVFSAYHEEYIQRIISNAERDSRPTYELPKILIIFDDVAGDAGVRKQITSSGASMMSLLAMRGRHFNISFILLTQYASAVSPDVRNNMDVAILFSADSEQELDAMYSSFGFGKKKKWIKMFTDFTHKGRDFYMFHRTRNDWDHKVYHNYTPVPIKHLFE
jgi:hypothetical protein